MKPGYNPTRRNRNIGTAAHGHGQDNKLVIPNSWWGSHVFWERLGRHRTVTRAIEGREFQFIVEETRGNCVHPCTVDDIVHVVQHIPAEDLQGLNLFVLRQPKRKEQILSPVWGRMAYESEFGDHTGSVVILEAIDPSKPVKWPRSLTPSEAKELDRLRQGGHNVRETKRHFILEITVESVRPTQLYRTLLHEIGHWVDYLEKVLRPASAGGCKKASLSQLKALYFARPESERETFAHRYADQLAERLRDSEAITFDRKLCLESLKRDGLDIRDFVPREP